MGPIKPARTYKLTARPPVDPTFRPLSRSPSLTRSGPGSSSSPRSDLNSSPRSLTEEDDRAQGDHLAHALPPRVQALPYTVTATPALGTHVRGLDIRQTWFIVVQPPPSACADLLRHTPHLQHLVGNGRTVLPWAAMCTLADSAGSVSRRLVGSCLRAQDGHQAIALLTRFTALRGLTWEHSLNFSLPAPFFDPAEAVPAEALPALEVLVVKSAEALTAFAQMGCT
ncbi:hypothetical protein C8F04DRAFT_237073 [Mycena alexandri]|uniref:Uncharacterized protein n=1 Tax=Mycena alexandri TaxID=1745969 RepID=A0AAD6WRK2_9AGAR|nr:hypothetical protein C8F04DRAFT_237073 [Mycena alexandri]